MEEVEDRMIELQETINQFQNALKKQKTGKEGKGNQSKGGKEGKGNKGKDKKGPQGVGKMPRELIGCDSLWEGEPICFDANMGRGCKWAATGQKCRRGWHMCCVKGCFSQDHLKPDHRA